MGNQRAFDLNHKLANDDAVLFEDVGILDFDRRLTDKILSAFNHAYSVGAIGVAEQLRKALVTAEKISHGGDCARQTGHAARQADLWVAFVEARSRYRPLARAESTDALTMSAALEEMKEAYKNWSMI